MTKQIDASQGTRMSRRKLIQSLSATVIAAGGVRIAVGQSGSPTSSTLPPPVPEHCLIYELLTLWLVFSTNKKFTFTIDSIVTATGLPKQRVKDALAIYQANQDDFNAAVDTFGELITLYDNPKYQPGECPRNMATLSPVRTVSPPNPCS